MKKMRISTSLSILAFFGLFLPITHGQKQTNLDIALRYIEQNLIKWDLRPEDVSDMVVSSQYQSKHNGVTHLYFVQRHQQIEVYNALTGVHIRPDGKIGYATSRFIPNLAGKINTTAPSVSAYQAVEKAAADLGLTIKTPLQVLEKVNAAGWTIFEGGSISRSSIPIKLFFQPVPGGTVRLAWNLRIDQVESSNYWGFRVDAVTGEILEKNNWTLSCNYSDIQEHLHNGACTGESLLSPTGLRPIQQALTEEHQLLEGSAQYHVFPIPVESPLHGNREIVSNPHDPEASPFGWHDTNGTPGAEYTITRGNNTHAFLDRDANNLTDRDEPDGGPDLIFDFPYDPNSSPREQRAAAVTQLFYMNNIMHDFAYHYGFDEEAGNFQQKNYQSGGKGGDPVEANAQDGSGFNNANFRPTPDGEAPRMQMFLWTGSNTSAVTVETPASIAGSYSGTAASFGANIVNSDTIYSAEVVLADDGSASPTLGCNPILNDVLDKIVLIDRGSCEFGTKALNAQNAGAIGVIVCNTDNDLITMGPGAAGDQVKIPAVFMRQRDCAVLKLNVGNGLKVRLELTGLTDSDFDNGIIAHEYAHGISHRLTGGPDIAECLFNDEQMGEGWSDFFALVTTFQPEVTGEAARGIGNYAQQTPLTNKGIRRKPYSTDFSINNQIYDDIVGTEGPHPLGEIWAATLWDLYWRFIEVYGWDDDLYTGNGGNNMAIQLVMDGMKLQECNPGFINGRDAIIAADLLNNDGANECLIWEVFARRGLGYSADQGRANNRHDGLQSFDIKPECIKELQLVKTATPLIFPGEPITYSLIVSNFKDETVSGVTVTDEIPEGAFYLAGSVTGTAEVDLSDGVLTFGIGEMSPGEVKTLTYKLGTSPGIFSIREFYDDMEAAETNWQPTNLQGSGVWQVSTFRKFSGNTSWFVPNRETLGDHVLQLKEPILVPGQQPVLRFYQWFNTEPAYDGGLVEISRNNGVSWQVIRQEDIFRNGYRGHFVHPSFISQRLRAFWGRSNGFVDTYVDLSQFAGQNILVRFRFASDQAAAGDGDFPGWYIDDVEVMDLANYQSEACVSSDEGDLACAIAPDRGTLVQTAELTSTDETDVTPFSVRISPNPAKDLLQVAFRTPDSRPVALELLSLDGRSLRRWQTNAGDQSVLQLQVFDLPAGMYFIRLSDGKEVQVEKVIIE